MKVLVALVSGVAAVAMLAASWRDLVNLVGGPFVLEREKLLLITDANALPAYHVVVEVDAIQTWFASEYTLGKAPYTNYALASVGDRKLLVHLPADHHGLRIAGTLGSFTRFEQQHLIKRINGKYPGEQLLPVCLEAARPLWPFIVYCRLLPAALLLGLALWCRPFARRRTWSGLGAHGERHADVHVCVYGGAMQRTTYPN